VIAFAGIAEIATITSRVFWRRLGAIAFAGIAEIATAGTFQGLLQFSRNGASTEVFLLASFNLDAE
jgi:hypothetical protein